jgi:hypothetical protein
LAASSCCYYPNRSEEHRILGGSVLTDEARSISRKKKLQEQDMLKHAQGNKDLVWTKSSQANVNLRSTMSFIVLIAFGTAALAASAMRVVVYSATLHSTPN